MRFTKTVERGALLGFAMLGLPAAFAFAADTPSAVDVIQGCYQKNSGGLRIVGSPAECRSSETPISWNQQGPKGDRGETGLAGAAGPAGPAGAVGATGLVGPPGADGAPGAPGAAGPVGPAGPQGPQGVPGPVGAAGETVAPASRVIGSLAIDGIAGPSTEAGHEGEFPIYSVSTALNQDIMTTGRVHSAGFHFDDLTVSVDVGAAAVSLHAHTATFAQHATVTARLVLPPTPAGDSAEFVITLSRAFLTRTEVASDRALPGRMTLAFTSEIGSAWAYMTDAPPKPSDPGGYTFQGGAPAPTPPGLHPVSNPGDSQIDYVVSHTAPNIAATQTWASRFGEGVTASLAPDTVGVFNEPTRNPLKATFSDISLSGALDSRAAGLAKAVLGQTNVPRASVRLVGIDSTGTPVDLLQYAFEDVVISSVQITTGPGGALEETLRFAYNKVNWEAEGQTASYARTTGTGG